MTFAEFYLTRPLRQHQSLRLRRRNLAIFEANANGISGRKLSKLHNISRQRVYQIVNGLQAAANNFARRNG